MNPSVTRGVRLDEDEFGIVEEKSWPSGISEKVPVRRFTWRNSSNITVQVMTYGATITSIKAPDRAGTVEDIVTGFNDVNGYVGAGNPYFGATVGRVANRIGMSHFRIDGNNYELSANHGIHQLHGGFKGFNKVIWNYYVDKTKVVMTYLSRDKEEGFPGDCLATVTFELTETNEFNIEFFAVTTKPTYVNLTNHSYFNLGGNSKGAIELYKHEISINADQITEVDNDSIPTGKLLPVAGTVFDLRIPKMLESVIHKVPKTSGFDHNFCITKGLKQMNAFVARVQHPASGRVLEVYSNQPGVQFYTGNHLPDPHDKNNRQVLIGKNGNYFKHGAFCLETQNFPDAINHPNFPSAALYPGKTYVHTVTYRFSTN